MNTPVTCFTALIDIAEEAQCKELEDYLRSKGSDIITSEDTELLHRLEAIIEKCSVVFDQKDISQQELEGFFYSIVSLFHVVSFDKVKDVVDSFCSKIVAGGTQENAEWRIKLLGLMFSHFSVKDPLCYTVICHRIKLAEQAGKTGLLALDVDQLCKWIELWQVDVSQKRNLFLLLWEAHRHCDKKTLSIRILKELLLTYTEVDSTEAKCYAEELIRLLVSDTSRFVFDDILELAPVKALEGQTIHNLLKVFVFDRLSSFDTFYSENKDFVDELNLDHSLCVTKMRQLTLSSIAVEQEVIPFSTLREELRLSQEQLEDFLLDCIRLKLVEAGINQVNQTLVIMSSIHRTFEKGQWELLHDRLLSWQQSIQTLKSNLKTIKT